MEYGIALVAGLLIGSFLNVCIYRWPRDHSIVWPGSRCTSCGHPIAWYDNVPLASYAVVGGRCRHCLARISWRYPLVEALTAGLFVAAVAVWGLTPAAGKFALFAFLQLGMIFSDFETRLLPDQFTKGGIVLGLALAWLVPLREGFVRYLLLPDQTRLASLLEAGFAAAFTSGALWLTGWVYSRVRKREGLGFGDVKMIAMIGAFQGISVAMLTLLVGCVGGSIIGLLYVWLAKKDMRTYELPFGSFLGAAALITGLVTG